MPDLHQIIVTRPVTITEQLQISVIAKSMREALQLGVEYAAAAVAAGQPLNWIEDRDKRTPGKIQATDDTIPF